MFPDPIEPADRTDPRELHPPGSYTADVLTSQLYVGTVSMMMPPKSAEQNEALLASVRQFKAVLSPLNVTPLAPNRDGVIRHRIDNGRHRLEAARAAGITTVQVIWNDPAWDRDELIRRMLDIETTAREWTPETRHDFIVKLNEEEHRSVRQIVRLTGWSHGNVQRALALDAPDTSPARPGESPERGSPRYQEIVRQCLDPDVTEDQRSWARADGGYAMMTIRQYRIAQDSRHAPELLAAARRFDEFAKDIGMPPKVLWDSFWVVAAEWPRDERKPRASYAAHAELIGDNKSLLHQGMDEFAAKMAAQKSVKRQLADVKFRMLTTPGWSWSIDQEVRFLVESINAILHGGRPEYEAYVLSVMPEPVCSFCGAAESEDHHRLCTRPRACRECGGVGGHTRADCPIAEREQILAEVRTELGYMARVAPRDRVPRTGDRVAGEAPPEDRRG